MNFAKLLRIPFLQSTSGQLLLCFYKNVRELSSLVFLILRSSRPKMFCKGVLWSFAIFTGKHLCWSLFRNSAAGLDLENYSNKRLQHRFFSYRFCKLSQNTFFTEHFWVTAFTFYENLRFQLLMYWGFKHFSTYLS